MAYVKTTYNDWTGKRKVTHITDATEQKIHAIGKQLAPEARSSCNESPLIVFLALPGYSL